MRNTNANAVLELPAGLETLSESEARETQGGFFGAVVVVVALGGTFCAGWMIGKGINKLME